MRTALVVLAALGIATGAALLTDTGAWVSDTAAAIARVGRVAAAALLGSLAVSLAPRGRRLRRALGLAAAATAALHGAWAMGSGWVGEWAALITEPQYRSGATAALMLALLAATSSPAVVRALRLGHWRLLHRAVYAGAALVVHHVALASRAAVAALAALSAATVLLLGAPPRRPRPAPGRRPPPQTPRPGSRSAVMGTEPAILRGVARAEDPVAAAAELAAAIAQPDATSFVFASSHYDLAALGPALVEQLGGPIAGCTTAGEITPLGYGRRSLVGFSMPAAIGHVDLFPIPDLARAGVVELTQLGKQAFASVQRRREARPSLGAFGVLLVDGMSGAEEQVIGTLAPAMPTVPVVGGSAGDDLRHEQTHVLLDGRFTSNAALLAVVTTERPFRPIKAQHFEPTAAKVVITGARPEERVVTRIDGRPAAEAYAALVGCPVDALTDEVFSTHPLMLKIGGGYYVRSIRRACPDGSLAFYCAIDEGLVLTLARSLDIVDTLDACLTEVGQQVGGAELIIGFECIHRRLEAERRGRAEALGEVLARHRVVGFHSYGEQADFVHINQTFTGVLIGGAPR